MIEARVQKEHQWLQRLVGEWTYETEAAEPGKPPEKVSGTERVRSVGGLWIVAEGEGEMPGAGHATSIITLGYDPQKQRFVGTWLGSMMTHLWICDGELDAAGRKLALDAEGPSMSGDGTSRYRDVIELVSDDHRVLTAHVLGDDGKWQQFMSTSYRRKQ
jgi:hypothetical protein